MEASLDQSCRRAPARRRPLKPRRVKLRRVRVRFYRDPESGLSHIHTHGVTESEVIDVLEKPGEDRPGREDSRVAIGQTRAGRYVRVIYVPDEDPDSVFVITAYELRGKPLAAYRRRRKRKPGT